MRIVLEKAMPNGSVGRFHSLDELVIKADAVTATVTTRPSEDGMVCWQDRVALSALTGEPYAAAIEHLVAEGGYLAGGIVQADPEPLETLRASMLTRLDRLRDERLGAGCATPLGPMDSDLISRQNVSGAVAMAMLAKSSGEPFAIQWRMRDNTYCELDADAMITAGVVVGRYVSAVYAVAFAAKDAITSATNVEELEAIKLNDLEWPA